MNPVAIKEMLQRTWMPFFSRFGSLMPIQVETIPKIYGGENVVIVSPSASGKTEAVIAPIIERILHSGKLLPGQMTVLYVSPTRALVNDLYRRLCEPVEYCGLKIGRKTGDLPRVDAKNLPNVLITTPESFDSLIARQPKLFLDLRSVILDEIHLLDNTPRGDQLRILLNRLRRIKGNIQYCALSATIDDLNIGTRYFSDPQVSVLESSREITFELTPAQKFIPELFKTIKRKGLNKILIFFNARSLVEMFSQQLRIAPFQDSVLVHHASLPRSKREETERVMNQSNKAILCATSTLELGIDVGDIDCVVLFRPPYNVSSLLQRIGRGNRRTSALYALGVYQNYWEKTVLEVFLDCARTGKLFEKEYQTSLSVIPQQLYSYLYQRRRIGTTINSLRDVMGELYGDTQLRAVIRKQITDQNIIETRPGIYQLSFGLEKKIKFGKIHSNIAEISFGEYDVIDAGTSAVVGRIFHLKKRFVLGGRCWEMVNIDERDKKVHARNIGEVPEFAAIFEGKGAGNYHYQLASVIKKRFFPALDPMVFPSIIQKKHTYVMHFFGSLYGFLLADAYDSDGIDAMDVDGKILVFYNRQLEEDKMLIPSRDSLVKVITRNLARLEDALGSGAYFYDLPGELQIKDHWNNLCLAGFLEFLQKIRLAKIEPRSFTAIVERLVKK